jgi:SAM-dependent methyltransferase
VGLRFCSLEKMVMRMSTPQNRSEIRPAEFDRYSRSYNEAVNSALPFLGMNVDFFTRVKMDYLVEVIETLGLGASDPEVLDVGCGIGNGHRLLADRMWRLTGIDVSQTCVERARERNPWVQYATYDGVKLPFAGKSFDVVFAVSVFHHVPLADRTALASEIRRILRPAGAFVLFEHNPRNPLTMRAVNNCEFDKSAILLDRRDSEALMATAGFQAIATRFILTVPAIGAVLRAVDRLLGTLPFGAQYYTIGRS